MWQHVFLGKEKHHCPRSTSNFRGCKSPNQESIGRSIPPWNNRSIHRKSHRNHFQHKISIHQAMTETQGLVFQTSARKYLEHHIGVLEKRLVIAARGKGTIISCLSALTRSTKLNRIHPSLHKFNSYNLKMKVGQINSMSKGWFSGFHGGSFNGSKANSNLESMTNFHMTYYKTMFFFRPKPQGLLYSKALHEQQIPHEPKRVRRTETE